MIPRILGLVTATVLLLPGIARAIDVQEVTSPRRDRGVAGGR